MSKLVQTEEFVQLSERDHVLLRPHVHLGDIVPITRLTWIFLNGTFEQREVTGSPGLFNTFREPLTNVADNIQKSREQGFDPGHFEVDIDAQWIRVKNFGRPIPVAMHSSGWWTPDFIFSNLRTSSNYDDSLDKKVAGQNGYGAKLTNIFSQEFRIRCVDAQRGKSFEQAYYDNLSRKSESVIEDTDEPTSIEVTYKLDHSRFGLGDGYSEEIIGYFSRLALEMAVVSQVPLVLNGVEYPVLSPAQYCEMIFPKAKTFSHASGEYIIQLIDTPNETFITSHVNGIHTSEGGVHVDNAYKAILETLKLNPEKTDKPATKSKFNTEITFKDLKKHISMFLTVRTTNPIFKNQSKEEFKAPKIKIEIPNRFKALSKNWFFMDHINAMLEFNKQNVMKQNDGKKVKRLKLKGTDANLAGTAKSHECTLFICEGDSACKYIEKLIHLMGGNSYDYIGYIPIRGKILNVINASAESFVKNVEISEIKRMGGLKQGLDFTLPENRKELRYGKFVIASDADSDGQHIKGLLLLLFSTFPSLFDADMIYSWSTPIIRVKYQSEVHKFYNMDQYDHFIECVRESQLPPPKDTDTKYYKGLASSEDDDIKEDLEAFYTVLHELSPECTHNLKMVFDSKYAEQRKEWVTDYTPQRLLENVSKQTVTEFIDHDLIRYVLNSLTRAIPSGFSGLKDVQNKALFYIRRALPHSKEASKISIVASKVTEETNYHHGDQSIGKAITMMCMDYAGSNNMPLFEGKGQLGSRKDNKIAAARYVFCRSSWWLNLVFRKEDDPILEYLIDDGKQIEPKYFLPIIPMVLVNGCIGLATGWSTCIPSYNPLDIVAWIRERFFDGSPKTELIPWYRDYKGTITVEGDHFYSRGIMEYDGKGNIIISELPIMVTFEKYKEFLDELCDSKIIRDFDTRCSGNQPGFFLKGVKTELTYEDLNLVNKISFKNMTILDENYRPIKFVGPYDLLEFYFQRRLRGYEERKKYYLEKLYQDLKDQELKIRFLELVLSGKLIVVNRKLSELKLDLARLELPQNFLNIKTINLTTDGLDKNIEKFNKIQEEIQSFENTQPYELWIQDLDEFEKAYRKKYKC